jgi:hypothetical protein
MTQTADREQLGGALKYGDDDGLQYAHAALLAEAE